jgi:uncharacterized protein YggT (Ycf19 family)
MVSHRFARHTCVARQRGPHKKKEDYVMEPGRSVPPRSSEYPTEPMSPTQPADYRDPVPADYRDPVPVGRQPADYRDPALVNREPVGYRDPVITRTGVSPAYRATRIVYLVLGIIEALLVIRLVLKLLAANPSAGFSSLVYDVTNPLVGLFQGVFPNAQSNGSVLDLAALLAILVYALLAWGIVRLIWITQRRQLTPPV